MVMLTSGSFSKWDSRFIELARLVSSWSKDPSTQCGAVIVRDKNAVVSLGYNGFPRGLADNEADYADRTTKLLKVIHAEENAMLFAKEQLQDCTIYTWPLLPCTRCAAKIIQVGITRVVSVECDDGRTDRWALDTTMAMFDEAGVNVRLIQGDNNDL